MAVIEINGKIVEVPDDISDAALANVYKSYGATAPAPQSRKDRVAAGGTRVSARQAEVKRRADSAEKLSSRTGGSDVQRLANKGIFASFGDEFGGGVSAATRGVFNAIRKGDISEIGNEYYTARDTERELDRRAADRSPVAGTLAEVGGALLNPVGAGTKLVQGVSAAAKALGATRVASGAGRVAAKMAKAGPIATGVMAGANQGALNAAGMADEIGDVPSTAAAGGLIGAGVGGVLGGAAHLGKRGVEMYIDSRPRNAERTAYSRIAQLLDNGKITPAQAERQIAVTDARGGDAMVQDLTPGLRAQAAATSRKPEVPSSNALIEAGDARIAARPERFANQVRQDAQIPNGGDDALARGDALAATRKADGQAGYAQGGIMDTPITPTNDLQLYLKDAPEPVKQALRGAYDDMLLRDENPAQYVGPDGIFTHIPNLRTFDYVKRAFDTKIGQALRSGDKAQAQGLSFQLDKLKGTLADANPADKEYKALLASQRDLFQQQKALETGSGVLRRMVSEPRVVMRDLEKLGEKEAQEARIGIIDALIQGENKANPVGDYLKISRSANQRKVLEFAFGGTANLRRFDRWVRRELKAQRADVLTAPGRQSETSRIAMADGGGEGIGSVLMDAFRGYGFGGATGAIGAVARKLQGFASGTGNTAAQEEIAKILLSKGEGLAKGIEATKSFQNARRAGNKRRTTRIAKGAQQIFTNPLGDN